MKITKFTTPAAAIFVYVFALQFIDNLYALQGIEGPLGWEFLSRIGLVWLIWWWLRVDSRERGIGWVLDLGMFLYLAWIVVLPYHLFKTRGWAAFVPILFFIAVALMGFVSAVVVWVVFLGGDASRL
jgi:hypothetical protein